jgi:hypothetical protein
MKVTHRRQRAMKTRGRFSIIAATCALVTLAPTVPALAGGRNDVYVGEIEQAPAAGFSHEKTIELYVHTQHHRDGRVTVKIPVVNIFDVYFRCQNGANVGAGFNAGGVTTRIELTDIKIEHRSFDQIGGDEEGMIHVKLEGTLPKHGLAKGTIDVSGDLGEVSDGEGDRENLGHCESGVLNWSAVRK